MIKKFFTLLCLCTLCIGSAWGEDPITTVTFSNWEEKCATYSSAEWSDLGCTFAYAANNSGGWSYVRMGGKGGSTTTSETTATSYIKYNTASATEISKVVIGHKGKSNASLTINSISLTVYSDSKFNTEVETVTISEPNIAASLTSIDELVFKPSSGGSWAAGSYFKFSVNWTVKGKNNYGLNVCDMKFYEPGIAKTPATIKFANTGEQTLYVGQTFQNVAKAYDKDDNEITSGVTISYVSSNTEKATVSEDGTVNVLASSTQPVNITASLTSDTYEADPVSYSMNLSWKYTTKPEITATSVEGGYLRESDNTFTGKINVSITRPASMAKLYYTTDESDPRASETRVSSEDASVELNNIENDITIKAVFADADGCYGYTTTAKYIHSAGDLYEVTYSVNGAETSSNYFAGESLTFPSVQPLGGKVFRGWVEAPLGEATDTEPTYTTDLTAVGSKTYYAVFATEEVSGEAKYELVETALTDWSGDYLIVYNNTNAMNTHSGNQNANTFATYTNISTYYNSSTKSIASNTTTDGLVYRAAKTAKGYSLYCVSDESYLGITSNTTDTGSKLRWNTSYSESVCDWTLGVGSIRNVGSSTLYIRWNNNSGQYRFAVYKSDGQQAIQLYKKSNGATYTNYCTTVPPRKIAVSVSENAATGLTTMYVDYATEIPEGVEAWYVSAYDATEDKLTMTQINGYVPANTAIIVKGTAGESYNFVETFETVDAISGTNLLTGSVTDSEAQTYTTDDGWYYLATSGNFKKYEGTGIVRKAHKAYLYLTDRTWSQSAKELTIDWGEPTGIKTIDNGQLTIDNSKAYNLNGVRVNQAYKGIVIMNGKKYINK